ncbi:hypothetical protein R6Q57_009508 [Mikania cordata]
MNPIFKIESLTGMGAGAGAGMGAYTTITEVEKRRLFLRSYQFSRKQSTGQKLKRSFFRVKRLIRVKLRSAKKMIWFRLRLYRFRRKSFMPLNHHNTSLCFW